MTGVLKTTIAWCPVCRGTLKPDDTVLRRAMGVQPWHWVCLTCRRRVEVTAAGEDYHVRVSPPMERSSSHEYLSA